MLLQPARNQVGIYFDTPTFDVLYLPVERSGDLFTAANFKTKRSDAVCLLFFVGPLACGVGALSLASLEFHAPFSHWPRLLDHSVHLRRFDVARITLGIKVAPLDRVHAFRCGTPHSVITTTIADTMYSAYHASLQRPVHCTTSAHSLYIHTTTQSLHTGSRARRQSRTPRH